MGSSHVLQHLVLGGSQKSHIAYCDVSCFSRTCAIAACFAWVRNECPALLIREDDPPCDSCAILVHIYAHTSS